MGYFVIKRSETNGQFIFRFNGDNHEQILASEQYYSKQSCLNGINSVKAIAPYDSSYRRSDSDYNYRFNMVAANSEIVARSSEGYTTKQSREKAIEVVKSEAPSAPVRDLS